MYETDAWFCTKVFFGLFGLGLGLVLGLGLGSGSGLGLGHCLREELSHLKHNAWLHCGRGRNGDQSTYMAPNTQQCESHTQHTVMLVARILGLAKHSYH